MKEVINKLIKKYPEQGLYLWEGNYAIRLYNKNNEFINLRTGYYEGIKIKSLIFDPLIKEAIEYYKKYKLQWDKYIKDAELVHDDHGTYGIKIYMNDLFYEENPKVKENDVVKIIKEALQIAI